MTRMDSPSRSRKILLSLTYYRPHVSGLTLYNQRLAEGLAERGWKATLLTSRYDPELPSEEVAGGVEIRRTPVWFRLGKGVVMPTFPLRAFRLMKEQESVVMSLPNTPIEALFLPLIARLLGRKVFSIFHCDIRLPPGLFNRLTEWTVWFSNLWVLLFSHRVVVYTDDYAESVPLLRWFRKKRMTVPPPVSARPVQTDEVERFRSDHGLDGGVALGFAGRIAAEKGIEVLLGAFEIIRRSHPEARLLLAGEWENVLGERKCRRRLEPLLERQANRVHLLGVLPPEEMATFFTACDVLVLPSLNRTESFGLVQVESMLAGTPVIASDLPGVRTPIRLTGMGVIVPSGDAEAIANAVTVILADRPRFVRPREEIEQLFSIEATLDSFERFLSDPLDPEETPSD